MGNSLLDLVAAVCAGEADDHLQLLSGVAHKLPLEGPLLGLSGPGELLVQVEQAVEAHGEGDEPPPNTAPYLSGRREGESRI